MKPFTLYALIFLFLVSCKVKSNVAATDSEPNNTAVNHMADSKNKEVPYKVLRSAPTLKHTVYKRGMGNEILFEGSFPKGLEIYFSNGKSCTYGRQRGVEHVSFPVKCTFYCPTINTGNWNSDMAQQLNDFEIEFYEPGNWYITFVR